MTLLLAVSLLAFQSTSQSPIDPLAASRDEARARYQKVELELARARLDTLTPEQRAARARLLEVLDAYVVRADFGQQDIEPGIRLPQFVDADGRRCAVAELLHSTGEVELVSAVAKAHNTAWIAELSGDARFLGWLDRNGLTLDEAARIQGPSMPNFAGPGDVLPPSAPAPDVPAPSTPEIPTPNTPAPGIPSGTPTSGRSPSP